MSHSLCSTPRGLAVMAGFIGSICLAPAWSSAPRQEPSIRNAPGPTVHIRLLDASTGRVLSDTAVEIRGDDGISCVTLPCPTHSKSWHFATGSDGYLSMPRDALQPETTIEAGSLLGDLIEDSRPDSEGGWVVELLPKDAAYATPPGPPVPLKLIDSRSRQPIANALAMVDLLAPGAKPRRIQASTNALGYVFLPFNVLGVAGDNAWVTVPGYKKHRVDFSYARRKTLLERE